jgi:hypothetical protein
MLEFDRLRCDWNVGMEGIQIVMICDLRGVLSRIQRVSKSVRQKSPAIRVASALGFICQSF